MEIFHKIKNECRPTICTRERRKRMLTHFSSIEDIVYDALQNVQRTREDDDFLYRYVCTTINPVSMQMKAEDFLASRRRLGIPSFETVSRARRKLQSRYPRLRERKEVEDARYERFKEAIEYAKK